MALAKIINEYYISIDLSKIDKRNLLKPYSLNYYKSLVFIIPSIPGGKIEFKDAFSFSIKKHHIKSSIAKFSYLQNSKEENILQVREYLSEAGYKHIIPKQGEFSEVPLDWKGLDWF